MNYTGTSVGVKSCPSCGWMKRVGFGCVNYNCKTNNPSTSFQLTINDPKQRIILSAEQLEALADMIAERLKR